MEESRKNRLERILLNAGAYEPSLHAFTSDGGWEVLYAQSEGGATPVQFCAVADSTWMVSGALYYADEQAATAIDSMRPITDALSRDILKALRQLKKETKEQK